jgi:hypothetical protein
MEVLALVDESAFSWVGGLISRVLRLSTMYLEPGVGRDSQVMQTDKWPYKVSKLSYIYTILLYSI